MGDVTTRLVLQDEASSKLSQITSNARTATNQLRQMGDQMDKAFSSNSPEQFATKLGKAIDGAEKDAQSLGKSLGEAMDELDQGTNDDFAESLNEAASGAEDLADAAAEAGESMEDLAESADSLGESIGDIGDGGRLDEVAQGAEEAGGAMSDAEGKAISLGSALKTLFAAVAGAKVLGEIKDFAVDSINLGRDFTSMMSEVQAISGASAAEIAQLEATARAYGSTTIFSATEAAEALKYMSLAGWDANQSSAALGGVLNLAAASGMGLGQASDMVTDYLSAFGMQANQAAYFADMLSFAQSNSNTTAEQLGQAFLNSAANMHSAGQDVETTTSLLEAMANQGTKGARAGTQLAAMARDLTNNMEDGQVMIGKTAIQVSDAEGNFRDFTDILTDVGKAVDGLGTADRANALANVFTADSIKGINQILNEGMDNIAGYEAALRNAGGAAEEAANIMNDNLNGDLANMNSAFEEMKLQVFEGMEEPLRQGVQFVTSDVIPALTEWVPDAFQTVAQGVGALGEKLGPLINTLLKNPKMVGTALTSIGTGLTVFKTAGLAKNMVSTADGAFELSTMLGKLAPSLTAHPWMAGAAALAGGLVLAKGAIDAWNETRIETSLEDHFGNIDLSDADISELAGRIIDVQWGINVTTALNSFDEAENLANEAENALQSNREIVWQAKVNTMLSTGIEDYTSPFVSAIQDTLTGREDSSGLSFLGNVDIALNPEAADGDLVQALVDFANEAVSGAEGTDLEPYAKTVAMEISPDGENSAALVQSLVDFAQGVVGGASGEELDPYLDNVLVNLTPEEGDSFQTALAALTSDIVSAKLDPKPEYTDTVSVKLTAEQAGAYQDNIQTFVESKLKELEEQTYAVELSIETVIGSDAGSGLSLAVQNWAAEDNAEMQALSSSLTRMVQDALVDGVLDVEEQAAIDILTQKINNIMSGWKEAQADAEWNTLQMKWSGKELTSDSFTSLISEAREQRQTAIDALDADTTEMNSVFNAWENSGKITSDQWAQLNSLWTNNYKNMEGDSIARTLGFAGSTLRDAYGDLISENLERISTMGGDQTIENLNRAADGGMWGTMMDEFMTSRDFISKNGGADRKALNQMYESMKPDVEDMGSLIDSYRKEGMQIPQTLMDAYNEAIDIGAASGDYDAGWQKFANSIMESGNEQLVDALTNDSNPMYETLRNQMPEELAAAVDGAAYAAENTVEGSDLSELFNAILGLDSGEPQIDLGRLSELCQKYGLDISDYLSQNGIDVEAGDAKISLKDFDPADVAQYSGLTATGNAMVLPGGEVAIEYEVNKNDTLSGIAEKTGVALEELKAANQQLFDERGTWDLIYEGDLIYVPEVQTDTAGIAEQAGTAAAEAADEAQAAADAAAADVTTTGTLNAEYSAGEVAGADTAAQDLAAQASEQAGTGEAISVTAPTDVTLSAGTVDSAAAVSAATAQTQADLDSAYATAFTASGSADVTLEETNNVAAIYSEVGAAINSAFSAGYSAHAAVAVTLTANYSLANPTASISFGGGATGSATVTAALHAAGGYFDTPHLGMVAEAGVGEYIIPMDGSDRSVDMWKDAGEMLGIDTTGAGTVQSPVVNSTPSPGAPAAAAAEKDKTINVNINGAGSIKVSGGGMSKEAIVEAMMENLREVFMNIVQQEIIEEGDGVYEY